MSGVLYIVATPIGNLDDITLRALSILREVDLIAAEDTRHSKHLLQHHGISTRMVSCHEHNESARSDMILAKLAEGSDVALISDAGTPLISDPGYRLVKATRGAGFRVSPIPGASSVITALSAAGLPTESFHFCGFLSARSKERAEQLEALRPVQATLVLFESSHRILRMLEQIKLVFPDHQCVIAKELTKLHERFMRGNAAELLDFLQSDKGLSRGEFVVLIDNQEPPGSAGAETENGDLLEVLLEELPLKMAVKLATRLTGGKKNELYQQALAMTRNRGS